MNDTKYATHQDPCRARFAEELDGLSPARLLVKLYDLAIAQCDREERERLVCTLTELVAALSFDHREVSMPLFSIYDHCIRQGRAGNFGDVRAVLVQLRDAWSQSAEALESRPLPVPAATRRN
jgi:flagellin-specific chaperone FliS